MISTVQVALFNDASALLALVNIELPLAAIPPIPSPLGLWSSTNSIRRIPDKAHIQVSIELIKFNYYELIITKHVEQLYIGPLIQSL